MGIVRMRVKVSGLLWLGGVGAGNVASDKGCEGEDVVGKCGDHLGAVRSLEEGGELVEEVGGYGADDRGGVGFWRSSIVLRLL